MIQFQKQVFTFTRMKTLQFKTTIMCSGCLSAVTPHLNAAESIESWEVDTTKADKILTVRGTNISEYEVVEKVQKAGFTATLVDE